MGKGGNGRGGSTGANRAAPRLRRNDVGRYTTGASAEVKLEHRLALGIRYCRTAQRGVKDRMAALAGQPWRREPGRRPVRSATGATVNRLLNRTNWLSDKPPISAWESIPLVPLFSSYISERQALFHRGTGTSWVASLNGSGSAPPRLPRAQKTPTRRRGFRNPLRNAVAPAVGDNNKLIPS